MISAHDYQTNNFMTVHKSLELVPEATFALTKLLSNQIFERMDKGLEELLKRQSKLQFTLPLTTIIAFSADFGTSQWLWQQEEFQKERELLGEAKNKSSDGYGHVKNYLDIINHHLHFIFETEIKEFKEAERVNSDFRRDVVVNTFANLFLNNFDDLNEINQQNTSNFYHGLLNQLQFLLNKNGYKNYYNLTLIKNNYQSTKLIFDLQKNN